MFPLFFAKPARPRKFSLLILAILLTIHSAHKAATAQQDAPNPQSIQPQDRINQFVDDERRIVLRGNRHPLADAQYDKGAVSPEYRMDRMVLTLLPDASQQEALAQLLDAQHNPESPCYHQWLTPEQYGERFGVSEADAAKVTLGCKSTAWK